MSIRDCLLIALSTAALSQGACDPDGVLQNPRSLGYTTPYAESLISGVADAGAPVTIRLGDLVIPDEEIVRDPSDGSYAAIVPFVPGSNVVEVTLTRDGQELVGRRNLTFDPLGSLDERPLALALLGAPIATERGVAILDPVTQDVLGFVRVTDGELLVPLPERGGAIVATPSRLFYVDARAGDGARDVGPRPAGALIAASPDAAADFFMRNPATGEMTRHWIDGRSELVCTVPSTARSLSLLVGQGALFLGLQNGFSVGVTRVDITDCSSQSIFGSRFGGGGLPLAFLEDDILVALADNARGLLFRVPTDGSRAADLLVDGGDFPVEISVAASSDERRVLFAVRGNPSGLFRTGGVLQLVFVDRSTVETQWGLPAQGVMHARLARDAAVAVVGLPNRDRIGFVPGETRGTITQADLRSLFTGGSILDLAELR